MTAALTIDAFGDILPPMTICPNKTDRTKDQRRYLKTIKDLTVLDNLCIVTQQKVWMDERVIMVWYEKMWLNYFRKRTERKRFYQVLNDNGSV